MKKLKIAAAAAIAALAVSAVAVAQDGVVTTHTMDAKVTPTKAGTKKKPRNTIVTVDIVTDPDHNPTVDVFTYQFPGHLRVGTNGFKYCTANKLTKDQTDNKCPRGSKIGFGEAQVHLFNRQTQEYRFDVAIYANKGGMTLWLTSPDLPDIRRAIPIRIQKGTDGFKQNLVADIPEDVEYQAGTPVILKSVSVTIGGQTKRTVRRNGRRVTLKYFAVGSRGCPANRMHTIGTKLAYKEPAGQPDTAVKATAPCSR